MKRTLTVIALWLFSGTAFIAQTPPPTAPPAVQSNGTIVANAACAANPMGTHDEYAANEKKRNDTEAAVAKSACFTEPGADFAARIISKEDFERQKAYAGFECRQIKYMSDGLKVVGFIWKPINTGARKLPLIILNHGGNREFSKLTPWQQFGYYNYVSNGFVVIGSQYRGIDGGEGKEEFGGADVNDVLNIIPLARSLGYVDMNNVFMLGWSRGAMMTFLTF